jgi:PGF-CTERM protein
VTATAAERAERTDAPAGAAATAERTSATVTLAPTTAPAWADIHQRTPTAMAGPGFGVVAALLAFVTAALLAERRD